MSKVTPYLYGIVAGYWYAAGYPPKGEMIYVAGIVSIAFMTLGYYLEKRSEQ